MAQHNLSWGMLHVHLKSAYILCVGYSVLEMTVGPRWWMVFRSSKPSWVFRLFVLSIIEKRAESLQCDGESERSSLLLYTVLLPKFGSCVPGGCAQKSDHSWPNHDTSKGQCMRLSLGWRLCLAFRKFPITLLKWHPVPKLYKVVCAHQLLSCWESGVWEHARQTTVS